MRTSGPSSRAVLLTSAALLLAALAQGCAPVQALIIAVALKDDSGGSAAPQTAPTAAVDPIPRAKGAIPIGYRLIDANSDSIGARCEYSTNGGDSYQDATLAAGAPEGTAGLSSSAGGVTHTFLWDVPKDLGLGAFTRVRFRVTPSDGTATGTAGVSPQGIVGNSPPVVAIDGVVRKDESNTKIATVSMTVTDSTSDLVDLSVQWEVLETGNSAVLPVGKTGAATILAGDVSNVASDPLGLPRSFVWNLVNDFKDVSGAKLRLTITPRDVLDPGLPSTVDDVVWLRDDRPVAFFLPVPRQAGTVTADYSLVTVDDRSDVSIRAFFDLGNPATLTFSASPVPGVDRFAATVEPPTDGLRAAPLGFGHLLRWDAPRDLAAFGLGPSRLVRLVVIPEVATATGSEALSNGFVAGNDAPLVTIAPIPSQQGGVVPVTFTLFDATSDPASVTLEVSQNGSAAFTPIPTGFLVGPITTLSTSPGGAEHTIYWNALAHLGSDQAGLAVRITPRDTQIGDAVASNRFDLTITGQAIAAITGPLSGTLVNGQQIAYKLFQATPSTASVDVVIRDATGATRAATPLPGSEGTTDLVTSVGGAAHTFDWDVATDFTVLGKGLDASGIFLEVRPRTSGGAGVPSTAGAFKINQNQAPGLALAAGGAPDVAPFRVPLAGTLTDTEGDAATITALFRLTAPTATAFAAMALLDEGGAPVTGPLVRTPGALSLAWDARAQLEALGVSGAALEDVRGQASFTAADNVDPILGAGTAVTTDLLLDLTAPPSATALGVDGKLPGEVIKGSAIRFTFTLTDPEGGDALVHLERLVAGPTPTAFVVASATAPADGAAHEIVYDSLGDGIGLTGGVTTSFRLSVADVRGPKKSGGSTAPVSFVVDNSVAVDAPIVFVQDPRIGAVSASQVFSYVAIRGVDGPVTITVRFEAPGISLTAAHVIDESGATHADGVIAGVTATAQGTQHTLTWTAGEQLGASNVPGIFVRVKAANGALSMEDLVGPFTLTNNAPPEATAIAISNPLGAPPFLSSVSVTARDADDVQARLLLEVKPSNQTVYTPLALTPSAAQPITVPASPGGVASAFVWDARAQLRDQLGMRGALLKAAGGLLRVTPQNVAPNAATGTALEAPFSLDLFQRPALSGASITTAPGAGGAFRGGVDVAFTVTSPDADGPTAVRLEVEVTAPGAPTTGAFEVAAQALLDPPPGAGALTWDTLGLVDPGVGLRDAHLRLVARDLVTGTTGTPVALGTIQIDNTPVDAVVIRILSANALGGGLYGIDYLATHAGVSVSADLRVSVEALGRTITAHPAEGREPGANPTGAVAATPAGALHTFVWDSRFDLPAMTTRVALVRFEVLSPLGPTVTSDLGGAFQVSNVARMEVVLGQPSAFSGAVNGGGMHLSGPDGGVGDAQVTSVAVKPVDVVHERFRVITPDPLNNRVLVWRATTASGGRGADLAVGQPGLSQHAANRGRAAPARETLSKPVAAAADVFAAAGPGTHPDRFAVVDAGNRRVAVYDAVGGASGQSASAILGQDAPDVGTGTSNVVAEPSRMVTPTALAFCPDPTDLAPAKDSMLLVVDRGSRRLLVYDPRKDQSAGDATAFLGALDGDEGAPPIDLGPDTFVDPVGVAVSPDGSVVYVSDAGSASETDDGTLNLTWRIWVARAADVFATVHGAPPVTPVWARVKPFTPTPATGAGAIGTGDQNNDLIVPSPALFRPAGLFACRDLLYPSLLYVASATGTSVYAFDLTEAPGGAVVDLGGGIGVLTHGVGDPNGGGITPPDELRPAFELAGLAGAAGGGAAFGAALDASGDEVRAGLIAAVSAGENGVRLLRAPVRKRSADALRGLIVNEVHPNAFDIDPTPLLPGSGDERRVPEWIEVINTAPAAIDLADVRLSTLDSGLLETSVWYSVTSSAFPLRQGERVVLVADTGSLPLPADYFPAETPVLPVRVLGSGATVSALMPDAGGAVVLFEGTYTGAAANPGKAGFVALDYVAYPGQQFEDPQPAVPLGFYWTEDATGQTDPLELVAGVLDADHDISYLRLIDGMSTSLAGDHSYLFFDPDALVSGPFTDPNSAGRPNVVPSNPFPACPTHTVVDLADAYTSRLGSTLAASNDVPASNDTLLMPAGVATPSSPAEQPEAVQLAIADRGYNRVVAHLSDAPPSDDGAPASVVLGQPEFTSSDPSSPSRLSRPEGVAIDPLAAGGGETAIYATDTGHARLVRWVSSGGSFFDGQTLETGTAFLREAQNGGPDLDPFVEPCDVLVRADDRLLYTLERGAAGTTVTGRVRIYTEFSDEGGTRYWSRSKTITLVDVAAGPSVTAQPLAFPSAVFATGRCLFIADTGNDRVLVLDVAPILATATATPVPEVLAILGGPGAPPDQRLSRPAGLFSTAGLPFAQALPGTPAPDEHLQLLVADTGGNRVVGYRYDETLPLAFEARFDEVIGQLSTGGRTPNATALPGEERVTDAGLFLAPRPLPPAAPHIGIGASLRTAIAPASGEIRYYLADPGNDRVGIVGGASFPGDAARGAQP